MLVRCRAWVFNSYRIQPVWTIAFGNGQRPVGVDSAPLAMGYECLKDGRQVPLARSLPNAGFGHKEPPVQCTSAPNQMLRNSILNQLGKAPCRQRKHGKPEVTRMLQDTQ